MGLPTSDAKEHAMLLATGVSALADESQETVRTRTRGSVGRPSIFVGEFKIVLRAGEDGSVDA